MWLWGTWGTWAFTDFGEAGIRFFDYLLLDWPASYYPAYAWGVFDVILCSLRQAFCNRPTAWAYREKSVSTWIWFLLERIASVRSGRVSKLLIDDLLSVVIAWWAISFISCACLKTDPSNIRSGSSSLWFTEKSLLIFCPQKECKEALSFPDEALISFKLNSSSSFLLSLLIIRWGSEVLILLSRFDIPDSCF